MLKRKIFPVLLALMLLTTFTACGKSSDSTPVIPEKANKFEVVYLAVYNRNADVEHPTITDELQEIIIECVKASSMHLVKDQSRRSQSPGIDLDITYEIEGKFQHRLLSIGSDPDDICVVQGIDTDNDSFYVLDDGYSLFKQLSERISN